MTTRCRFCREEVTDVVLDLGLSPISNEFRGRADVAQRPQVYYPLAMLICGKCHLTQICDVATPPHFNANYAYFSSYSQSWLQHAKDFAARMTRELRLSAQSQVVEIGSNDGYLLQYFAAAGVPVLGVEPSANVAEAAFQQHGIKSIVKFFDRTTALELATAGTKADLIVANNVLAHVPDLNSFISGFKILLDPAGTIVFEFPHLLRLISECQFDTIYHEHYSYLSLAVVERMLQAHALEAYAVEQLETHGGSLRLFVRHEGAAVARAQGEESLNAIRAAETAFGLDRRDIYRRFAEEVHRTKFSLLSFLIEAKRGGKTVLGYGAPAKANTLLNYCGIGPELLAYTVDRSPYKQGRYLPGVNIPIEHPHRIFADRPDYVLVLPWNLRQEIVAQLAGISAWGGKFVTAIPRLEVFG
ncbi:MAG: class I SAM-dependent methyltransferase [Proteobacteria bacterium]|nr:class I SAM-dependent methyltransferase [Pseudomonadota bacterium]